jgi:Flp pilus assembly protein TadG
MTPRRIRFERLALDAKGQSMIEMAMVLPLFVLLVLGIIEFSYALLDEHVVNKLTREGSNLISRDTTLSDAATALTNMQTQPVNFSANSTVIFSVIKHVATTGAANYDKDVLYQRYSYGSLSATSKLSTRGSGSFGSAPNYQAINSDNDTSLQLTNLPANLTTLGGMAYATEVFSSHPLITPFDKFGVALPTTLYSIAYF